MPVGERQLRSQDHRSALIAVIAKLQKIAPLAVFQRSHSEVVQDQDVDAREFGELAAEASVDMRDGEIAEHLSGPFMQDREAVATGFLCERTT